MSDAHQIYILSNFFVIVILFSPLASKLKFPEYRGFGFL